MQNAHLSLWAFCFCMEGNGRSLLVPDFGIYGALDLQCATKCGGFYDTGVLQYATMCTPLNPTPFLADVCCLLMI
jgi:hypothetical protein